MIVTVATIIGAVISCITIYFLARSNARENQRQRLEAQGRAVADALAPVQRENNELRLENRELRQLIRDKDKRIDDLEDELRRPRPR